MNVYGKQLFEQYNEVRAGLWQGNREIDLRNYEQHMGEIYRRYYKKFFGSNKNLRVLEIGCSTGGMLQAVYKDGFHYLTGIDMCEANIKIAKKRNKKIRYIVGDAIEFLKNTSEKFDIIYSRAVFEYMNKKDVIQTVQEIKEHCSGGY